MAEEEKPKQLVQPSTVIASGITAIVAALFTSRLGVAGTLIGTALTPMLMTIGVAVLNAQIEKATSRVSDLPSTVRDRLSTQRVRVPGTPTPDERPEEPEPPLASRRRDRRTPGVFERLLSIPTFLKEMSPSARRRTLLTGVAAGLVAAVIGLVGVTGLEAASRNTLSCSVWDNCTRTTASGEEVEGARPSILQAFADDSQSTDTQNTPSGSEEQPSDVQQPAPVEGDNPQNGQYEGGPQSGGEQAPSEAAPEEQPAAPAPQEEQSPVQEPNAGPQDGSGDPAAAPDSEQQPAVPSE